MVKNREQIIQYIAETYGAYYEPIGHIDPLKQAKDAISEEKIHDQITQLHRFEPDLIDKKLLEVGSGFGMFTIQARREYGIKAYGVEPNVEEGFGNSVNVARELCELYGIGHQTEKEGMENIFKQGTGEQLPYADGVFDIVYSSNVLEHVQDVEKVFTEAIRVLRPGGLLQFVIPNYGSLYEGHYCIPWIPYLPKWLAKLYIRLWRRSNPSYIDSLQFVTYGKIRRILNHFSKDEINVLSFGEDAFRERMTKNTIPEWAGLVQLKKIVLFARRWYLARIFAEILIFFRAYTPLIITVRKK